MSYLHKRNVSIHRLVAQTGETFYSLYSPRDQDQNASKNIQQKALPGFIAILHGGILYYSFIKETIVIDAG